MSSTPDGPPAASPRARPLEIEEPLNRLVIHPLSRRLVTLLIPTGITPNMVSMLGVLAAAAAAAAYAWIVWPMEVLPGVALNLGAFVGFIFHLCWHVLDGADGDLARRTGKTSPAGEVVDGICDYLAHIIVYVVLAFLLTPTLGGWAWLLASAAGVSRAVEANHYESARRTYQWWIYGVRWIRQTMGENPKPGPLAALARAYLAVSGLVSAEDAEMDALHDALMASPKAGAARELYAGAHRKLVKRASWLGALHETQAIFVAMLAGSAAIFFVYELVVLNAVMIWSIFAQKRANAALKPRLRALLAA